MIMDWQAMLQVFQKQSQNPEAVEKYEEEFIRAFREGATVGCYEIGAAMMGVLDGLFCLNADGIIGKCMMSDRMNSQAEDYIGRRLCDILSADAYHAALDAMELCRTNNTYTEFCFKWDNGKSIQTVSATVSIYGDGYIAIIRDVSRHQELFDRLDDYEKRYQMIANSIGDTVAITDTDGRLTFISKSAERVIGWTPDQVLGRSVFEFIHPQDAPAIREYFGQHPLDPQASSFEYRFLKASGGYVWLDTVVQAILGADGRTVAYQGVSRDVTDHRATERRLRQLWHLFEQSSGMFAVVKAEGKIDYINPSMLRYLGMSEADIHLLDFDKLLPVGTEPKLLYKIHQAIYSCQPWHGELSGKAPDGAPVTCLTSVSPVIDDLGEMTHYVVELIDITERKRAEMVIEQKSEELSIANRELQEFAYVVSHDLKAPLRSIGALADWLVTDYAGLLPEEGQEHLMLLKERSVRMQHLIDGVLAYSRVGRVSEQASMVDIGQLLLDVCSLLNPPPNMHVTIQPDMPTIYAEPIRLMQLFQNLISNAIKYNDKPEGFIEVYCVGEGDMWKFAVKDNGPGIAPKHHELVFGIFQTLNSKDDSPDSTGIGLSLVRKVVELYHGKIWIESDVNQGCTFWFTLPKQPLMPPSDDLDQLDD